MYDKPKNPDDLKSHSNDCEEILIHIKKYWDGLDDVKPKGYEKYIKDYEDYQDMDEWYDSYGKEQMDNCNIMNDDNDFITNIALPYVAYGDICQGRSPIYTLISSCMSYGFERGKLYGIKEGIKKQQNNMSDKLLDLMTENLKGVI